MARKKSNPVTVAVEKETRLLAGEIQKATEEGEDYEVPKFSDLLTVSECHGALSDEVRDAEKSMERTAAAQAIIKHLGGHEMSVEKLIQMPMPDLIALANRCAPTMRPFWDRIDESEWRPGGNKGGKRKNGDIPSKRGRGSRKS